MMRRLVCAVATALSRLARCHCGGVVLSVAKPLPVAVSRRFNLISICLRSFRESLLADQ